MNRWCADLPSPEERIFESIHASQRKAEHSILGSLVPTLPVVPERAIRVRVGIRLDAPQVETTVVVTIAVFSGKTDTEAELAGKSWSSTSWRRNEKLTVAHMSFILAFQVVQALPGQIPPILPSGAVTLMGSVLGSPLNAK
jgi:hypothetical protein